MILARNEARNLPLTLESISSDMPVLVIDHESTDATAHIASQAGARVITRAFDGFVNARRFALSQVSTEWTFMIDADERPDSQLVQSLRSASTEPDGYLVSRDTLYRGRTLRLWRNERLLRVFKTARATVAAAPAAGGAAQLHERWQVPGKTPLLRGTLVHDSYPTRAAYREKFEEYTDTEARSLAHSPAALAAEVLKTPLRFAWYAFAKGAALDGADGLRVAWDSSRYRAVVRWKCKRSR